MARTVQIWWFGFFFVSIFAKSAAWISRIKVCRRRWPIGASAQTKIPFGLCFFFALYSFLLLFFSFAFASFYFGEETRSRQGRLWLDLVRSACFVSRPIRCWRRRSELEVGGGTWQWRWLRTQTRISVSTGSIDWCRPRPREETQSANSAQFETRFQELDFRCSPCYWVLLMGNRPGLNLIRWGLERIESHVLELGGPKMDRLFRPNERQPGLDLITKLAANVSMNGKRKEMRSSLLVVCVCVCVTLAAFQAPWRESQLDRTINAMLMLTCHSKGLVPTS